MKIRIARFTGDSDGRTIVPRRRGRNRKVAELRSLSIVATTIVTPDNQVILIPNRNVWCNVNRNVTASDRRHVDLLFGNSYDDSIADAVRVVDEVVKTHPLVHESSEPMTRMHDLADSSVNFICRP